MLVEKIRTACVWFIVDSEEKLRLPVEDNMSSEVLVIFTEEFPTPRNLLEVAIMLVEKIETACVWFTVDSEEKLRLPVEGDMSGGVLDIFTEEFRTPRNLLEVAIMLVSPVVTGGLDNTDVVWIALVEVPRFEQNLDAQSSENLILVNIMNIIILQKCPKQSTREKCTSRTARLETWILDNAEQRRPDEKDGIVNVKMDRRCFVREMRDQMKKIWDGRHCRENKGNKSGMV